MDSWWIFDGHVVKFRCIPIFNVSPMDLLWAFDGFSIDVHWMFGRNSIDSPLPISHLPFTISLFPLHMSMSLFDNPLPISHCLWLGLAECAERLNKIRRPCRMASAGVSNPHPKSTSSDHILQISNPPQISPHRPCAFRPADPKCARGWFW